MTDITNDKHPSNDELMDYAAGDQTEQLREHLQKCAKCMLYVSEIIDVTNKFTAIPEEKIPADLQKEMLRAIEGKKPTWIRVNVFKAIFNPFAISLGMITLIMLFYMYIVYIL